MMAVGKNGSTPWGYVQPVVDLTPCDYMKLSHIFAVKISVASHQWVTDVIFQNFHIITDNTDNASSNGHRTCQSFFFAKMMEGYKNKTHN